MADQPILPKRNSLQQAEAVPTPDLPNYKKSYGFLLAAFNKLCVRANLDPAYEMELRKEAGL